MAVTIRLARRGKKKQPHYFIVAQDKEKAPRGAYLEKLGYYNPRTNPLTIKIDLEKTKAWIKEGAKPSEAVERLIRIMEQGGPKEKRPNHKKFGKHREDSKAAVKPAEAESAKEEKPATSAKKEEKAPVKEPVEEAAEPAAAEPEPAAEGTEN